MKRVLILQEPGWSASVWVSALPVRELRTYLARHHILTKIATEHQLIVNTLPQLGLVACWEAENRDASATGCSITPWVQLTGGNER